MLILAVVCHNTSIVELCLIHSLSLCSLYSLPSEIQAPSLSQGTTGLLCMVEAKGPSILQLPAMLLSTSVLRFCCTSMHSPMYLVPPACHIVHALCISPSHHPPLPLSSSGPAVGFPCPLLHDTPCTSAHYAPLTV